MGVLTQEGLNAYYETLIKGGIIASLNGFMTGNWFTVIDVKDADTATYLTSKDFEEDYQYRLLLACDAQSRILEKYPNASDFDFNEEGELVAHNLNEAIAPVPNETVTSTLPNGCTVTFEPLSPELTVEDFQPPCIEQVGPVFLNFDGDDHGQRQAVVQADELIDWDVFDFSEIKPTWTYVVNMNGYPITLSGTQVMKLVEAQDVFINSVNEVLTEVFNG